MTTLHDDLADCVAFEHLAPEHLAVLEAHASRRHVDAGAHLLRIGGSADEFSVVTRGWICIETHGADHGRIVVDTVGPRHLVGWSWLRPPYRWCFDARANEPTDVVVVAAEPIRQRMEDDHDFGYAILQRFSRLAISRLVLTRLRLLDLYGEPRPVR